MHSTQICGTNILPLHNRPPFRACIEKPSATLQHSPTHPRLNSIPYRKPEFLFVPSSLTVKMPSTQFYRTNTLYLEHLPPFCVGIAKPSAASPHRQTPPLEPHPLYVSQIKLCSLLLVPSVTLHSNWSDQRNTAWTLIHILCLQREALRCLNKIWFIWQLFIHVLSYSCANYLWVLCHHLLKYHIYYAPLTLQRCLLWYWTYCHPCLCIIEQRFHWISRKWTQLSHTFQTYSHVFSLIIRCIPPQIFDNNPLLSF